MNPIVQTFSNLDVNSRGGCSGAVELGWARKVFVKIILWSTFQFGDLRDLKQWPQTSGWGSVSIVFSMMWFCKLSRADESVLLSESRRFENLLMFWVGCTEEIITSPESIRILNKNSQIHNAISENNFPNTLSYQVRRRKILFLHF